MHIQNFIKIHPFCSEDIEENTFLHQSRAITVVYIQIKPIYNPKPILPDINVHAKIEENWPKTTQVRVRKRRADGLTDRCLNDLEGIT